MQGKLRRTPYTHTQGGILLTMNCEIIITIVY